MSVAARSPGRAAGHAGPPEGRMEHSAMCGACPERGRGVTKPVTHATPARLDFRASRVAEKAVRTRCPHGALRVLSDADVASTGRSAHWFGAHRNASRCRRMDGGEQGGSALAAPLGGRRRWGRDERRRRALRRPRSRRRRRTAVEADVAGCGSAGMSHKGATARPRRVGPRRTGAPRAASRRATPSACARRASPGASSCR